MIILDTHVFVWMVVEPRKLSPTAAARIRRASADEGLGIASITLLELAMLLARGRLQASGTIEGTLSSFVRTAGVAVKGITPVIASLAVQFPNAYPADPADRLIGATARAEGLVLITQDKKIRDSGLVKTLW